MSQLSYEYESNPALQDVEALRKKWQNEGTFQDHQDLYNALYQFAQKTETGLVEINRKLRESQGEQGGGGGGTVAPAVSTKKDPYVLCNLIFENSAVGYNEFSGMFESATIINFPILNRDPSPQYKPIFRTGEILEVAGDIWFEAKGGGTPEHHHVRMLLAEGSPKVAGGNRLSFNFGFERFNDYTDRRKKFFLDIFEYEQEISNQDVSQIINEIPVTSRKFRSVDYTISEANLSLYYEVGLWLKLDLSIFFK